MRAQAATEYLIMFAVVVIIALIVVGVLSGFPRISGGISERESAAYWATAEIAIPKYYISTNPQATRIAFRNSNNFPVRLDYAYFGDQLVHIDRTLYAGGTLEFNGTRNVICFAPGEKYYFNVSIRYRDLQSGSPYSFVGERPLVGVCQQG